MNDRRLPNHDRSRPSWRHTLSGLAVGFFALLPLGGCDDESGGSCVENETQECVCPGGMGAQTCQADGTWGACSCGGGDGGGGDGSGGAGDDGGGADDGGGDDGGGDDGGGDAYSCCLNGSFYACPDADASNTCFSSFDPSGCSADPARNAECDGGGETGGDDSAGDGGVCSDPGQPCSTHSDCCDSDVLCVDGTCAAACAFDDECASLCCADLEGGGGACAPPDFC